MPRQETCSQPRFKRRGGDVSTFSRSASLLRRRCGCCGWWSPRRSVVMLSIFRLSTLRVSSRAFSADFVTCRYSRCSTKVYFCTQRPAGRAQRCRLIFVHSVSGRGAILVIRIRLCFQVRVESQQTQPFNVESFNFYQTAFVTRISSFGESVSCYCCQNFPRLFPDEMFVDRTVRTANVSLCSRRAILRSCFSTAWLYISSCVLSPCNPPPSVEIQ